MLQRWFVKSGQGATADTTWFRTRKAAVAEARALRAFLEAQGLRRMAAGRVRVGWALDPV